ncbi:gliding motility-associated C-terminal domain-containing protein [Hymenobacter sp. BT683]|uniref:Gliding motility-associated C-terminal domain-containing protein n=1 Tax=Hymenobacter jeongseonensis TaxID=2791027 RepID=A0ABS0IJL7_9BACT|nr:gliding motility-associated C-terminal domain-containing protein [Hymenobacter jeongseonensis]MBF9238569.1 gliding motility-associated C-terminal domain-containing protein [Hymenobacter jeongseonensis]
MNPLFRAICRCFVAMLPVFTLLATAAHAAASEPTAASLEFIQNKGQWDRRVRYQAALPAGRLFVQADALTYTFLDPATLSQHHEGARARPAGANAGAATADIAAHAYTVHFERANPQVRLSAEGPTAGERNYFVGADATRWASHVGAFRRLRYTELWPGIDLTLYENATQHLEYDVLLAPRANPARVALRYDGARDLALNAAGNLVISTTVSTTTELAPKAWQLDAAGRPQAVACRYVLTGRTITFALGPYDKSRALTIDPTVQFSTLTGSTADNWGFTATYDNAGNMYSGGIVFNSGGTFPATPGAYRTSFSSVVDMAIIKYNTQLTGPASRVWATYLGGNEADFPHSLVVNGQNELVILGSTSSINYPTTAGAMQSRFGGGTALDPFGSGQAPYLMPNGSDLVITRLNATGSALLASTYFGGAGNDGVVAQPRAIGANYGDAFRSDVLLDGAGNVYIAAATSSANLMGLTRGFNPTYRGGPADALVSKLTPALDAAVWTGFLGGTGADAAYSVQRDGQGRVYVCGGTTSANFPTTTGAYLADAPGGGTDGFAARISPDGRTLERATFIGTDSYDQAYFLQLDAAGHPYLFGQTLGQVDIPDGLFGDVGGTQFIQKLDPDLMASIYNTVFGNRAGPRGGPNLVPTAFLVDDCERVYISGWGGNTNNAWLGGNTAGLPVTGNAMQGTTDGSDFYLAQFAAGMTSLEYGTFYGQQGGRGEHVDGGTSRFDKRGVVYQAVCASCSGTQGFPVPPGAGSYSTRNGSANCNNAAFKINFEVVQADPGPRRYVCVDDGNISLSGSPAGGVWSGPGVEALPGGGYQFVPSAVGAGQYLINYTVQATGTCQSTRAVRYLVAPAVVPAFAPVPPQCTTMPILTLSATPAGGAFSGPGVSGGRFNPAAAGAGTHTLTYAISDSLGCGVITQQVVVGRPPAVSVGLDTTLCADLRQPFQLHGSPAGGAWSGTGVSATGFFTPPDTNNRGGVFPITYTVVDGACQAAATQRVILAPTSAQDVGLNLPVCAAAPQYTGLAPFKIVLTPVLLYSKAVYLWNFGDGTPTSSEATPTHTYQQPGTYKVTLTARYGNCEVLTGFAPVVVGDVFVPNIITPNNDELNQTFRPRFSCRPASLEVFSRWGQRVYQTNDYQNNWDAKGVPNGIYYYLLRDADDRRVKGWVEVRR